jgi:hypothetical protein
MAYGKVTSTFNVSVTFEGICDRHVFWRQSEKKLQMPWSILFSHQHLALEFADILWKWEQFLAVSQKNTQELYPNHVSLWQMSCPHREAVTLHLILTGSDRWVWGPNHQLSCPALATRLTNTYPVSHPWWWSPHHVTWIYTCSVEPGVVGGTG